MADDGQAARPRVLVLGGGFAGVGAARALKKADVDVVVVDKHDYHTFQPLLYQVATALLEPAEVGHPLRDLFHDQKNARVHVDSVTGIDLARPRGQFAEMKPLTYDYLVLGARRRGELLRRLRRAGARVPDVHTRRRRPSEEARSREVGGRGQGRRARRGRRTAHRRRRRRPHRRGERGRAGRAVQQQLRRGLPRRAEGAGAKITLVEASPQLFGMFKENLRDYTKQQLEKCGVEVLLGEIVESVEPTRVTLKSGKVLEAHTLVWGAGLHGEPDRGRARARAPAR